jgi:hypothetical protein
MKELLESLESEGTAAKPLEECIIVAGRIAGGMMFAKNRDRPYKPEVRIVHEVREGVEVAYLEDISTGWREGLNEYGIGVVNTALMVRDDEKEKQRIARGTIVKTKDGLKILAALSEKTVKAACDSIVNNRVHGHTFVGSPDEMWSIEGTSRHPYQATKVDISNGVEVRTNHGLDFEDAGYRDGEDRYSSMIRKISAERAAEDAVGAQDMMRLMRKKAFFQKSKAHLNMMRETKKMNTVSQMAMDLDARILYFNVLKDKVDFRGVDEMTPVGYRPRIRVVVTEIKSSSQS